MKKSVSFLVPVTSILLIAITVMVVSCSKSGGGAKPKLSIESINSPIEPNGQLNVKLKFSNGGDLSNGTFVAIRIRTNILPPQNTPGGDTVVNPIPSYGNVQTGEMVYTQDYQGYLTFGDNVNDTLIFRFAVISSAGVSSDTITSPKVVVIHP